MRAPDGIYYFDTINANYVADAIRRATVKYFGEDLYNQVMQDSVYSWLSKEFFSGKTYSGKEWTLYTDINTSRMSGGYKALYGLERFGIDLFYENSICLKKLIANKGVFPYTERVGLTDEKMDRNRLQFLCEFNIDIQYRPESWFNTSKKEYYRVTLIDTVDVFTSLPESDFVRQ